MSTPSASPAPPASEDPSSADESASGRSGGGVVRLAAQVLGFGVGLALFGWCIAQALADKNGATALSFSSDLGGAMSSDRREVWISAGAIQYISDAHPASLLEKCGAHPRHILLNKLPLYDGEDFVTTQNIGEGSFWPVHVYNKTNFIRSVESMGYILCDAWDVHERSMQIPCQPEHSFASFSGLYFLRRPSVRHE